MKATTGLIRWSFEVVGAAFAFIVLASPSFGDEPRFDVNDVSYLWPVPKSKEDVAELISVDDLLADGVSPIWPTKVFNTVIQTAQSVEVTTSANTQNRIDFRPFVDQFSRPSTWKIVAFRVDPSAPGCDAKMVALFGSTPQVRLIAQPVTVSDSGQVKVHDLTVHLVFSFTKGAGLPAVPMGPPRFIPDKEKFREIIDDLKSLKTASAAANASTEGNLSVHPGLKAKVPGFAKNVRSFVTKHVSEPHLAAVAFMGLDTPEPWIFFAMSKKMDGTFALAPHPTLGGKGAQMLTFRGGDHVMPVPSTKNVAPDKGVSTAVLFENDIAGRLVKPVFDGLARPLHQDIPDIIANPQRAHFFNTDCVSCHSESTRRKDLLVPAGDGMFRYAPPTGISGVDSGILPQSKWNVRNFGWFPGGTTVATASTRTANEAAESADFINREYLGHAR